MKLVLVPEPAAWLAHVGTMLGPEARGQVLAPWALPALPERYLPTRLRAALRRRRPEVPDGFRVRALPGWTAVEAGLRVAGRSQATVYRARFAVRRAVARLAATLLPEGVTTVVAPSLGAREVFAAARARGVRCVLVEDLPSLRALHADLDAAFARHPEESFLRNHRASARDVARQEAERLLADDIWVRGEFAREQLLSAGLDTERIHELLPTEAETARRRGAARHGARTSHAHRVALLAGPALARMGVREAVAALDARPEWSLWVRTTEDSDLLHLEHPRVRPVTAQVQQGLAGVDVVLAPAWCESHPPELARAVARGIPVIATDRAAGFLPCRTVPRGNVPALVAELDALAALR
jgi:hypothetical protein